MEDEWPARIYLQVCEPSNAEYVLAMRSTKEWGMEEKFNCAQGIQPVRKLASSRLPVVNVRGDESDGRYGLVEELIKGLQ